MKKIVKKAKVVAKKVAPEKPAKKVAAVKIVKVPEITSKELVAKFLEGKAFPNSRDAGREFRKEHPNVKIKQAYFYTLFASFGTRTKKKTDILNLIKNGNFKNCMHGYNTYKSSVPANEKAVAFTYFLNLWKKEKGLTGPIRAKATPKVKAVKAKAVAEPAKVIELSKMSAKQILVKTEELLQDEVKVISTDLKNKTKIVKQATALLTAKGYTVA